ncbi:cytochrome b/b6 domain-containing protein [Novosphingobium aquae]|uniref:Cytochrome b/b6 domain-containing protein n=1 Tax=Novosphingobium aquae TaxID=3133435 RepID=A0ABU8S5C9_9SPHN
MKSLRFYHLLLGAGCLLAWFTAEELGLVHAWTGYVVALLTVLRLVLGLIGKSGFQFRRLIPRAGGHGAQKPAISAALSLALLLAVSGTATTGILMDKGGTLTGNSIRAHDGERSEGDEGEEEAAEPATLLGLAPSVRAEDGDRGEREEGLLGEVHETLGNLILLLAILHALYLLIFRFQTARFMLFVPRKPA